MSKLQKTLVLVISAAIVLLVLGCAYLYINIQNTPAPVPAQAAAAPKQTVPTVITGDGVVISEFMEKNRAILADEDGDYSDWIELWNLSDEPVALDGWHISDDAEAEGWPLDGIALAPGESCLLFASGKDRRGASLHTDFSLSGEESIYLFNADGRIVDNVRCMDCKKDIAVRRLDDGTTERTEYPTPGFRNDMEGYAAFQQSLTVKGPLAISEVMTFNDSFLRQAGGEYPDWVELQNVSDGDVYLADYYISDDNDARLLCRLPDRTLKPGELCFLLCAPVPEWSTQYDYTGFSLDAENEQLYLSDAGGALIDALSVKSIPYGCSYGRMAGENGAFYFDTPSPDAPNADGKRCIADMPVCLTPDGVYEGVDSVTVELSGSGVIRYTLDGSAPTIRSEAYTAPLTISKTTVLRAVNYVDGALPSRVLTESFFLNEGHSLPVVSLATDDPTQYRGMYFGMAKDMELPASVAFYDGENGFRINCGVSLNGETSLILAKKNMSLRFRAAYGCATLDYDLYGGGVTEFTNLLLRAGQDQEDAVIRNELAQELALKATDNVINQRSRYCVLYVNGEYRGICTLKEKANEQLYASVANVSRDSVEMFEASVPYDSSLFTEVMRFCLQNDMSLPENYAHVCELVDIDSVIDWTILESYCANVDLKSGNLRYCRSAEADGRWRLMFYDLDAAFRSEGGIYMVISDYGYDNLQVSSMLVPLMKNAEYRDRFLQRAAELYVTVLNDQAVLDEIDRLVAEITPELPRDLKLLNRTEYQWELAIGNLRGLITDHHWTQLNIDKLCEFANVSKAERTKYFGEIDGK